MSARSAGRRGVWGVRLLRLALVVVAVRLLLAALAPTALQLVLRRSGVEASWRAIHVGYLRGRVEVEGLAIAGRAAEGQPPLAPYLRSEAVRVDYAMKSLFSGPPRIQRLELASPRLALERRPDGTLHLLPAAAPAAAEPQPPEEGPIDAREPLDISSPFAIDHLRIQGAQVLLRDGAASPAREWRLDLDARGDELGKVEGPGRLEIRGSAPGMFDDARLVLDGGTTRDAARAVLDLRAAGVRPAAVAPFVAGLEADERVESADLEGRVELEARVLDPQQSTFAGELTLERWTARADGESVAHVDRARIELASLGSAGARVPLAVVEGAGLRARRDERGRTCALGFAFPGAAPAEPASPPGAGGGPFRFAAEVLRASAVAIDFRDEVYEPATELGLRVEKAEVLGLDTAPEGPEGDVPIRVDVVAALPGVASSVTLSGTASPFSGHRALDLTLVADGIDPRGLEPHLLELGVESTLRSGRLTAHLTGSGAETPEGRIEGDLRLGDLSFTDGDELLQLGSIDLAGVSIDPAARALRVREVAVRGTAVPLARGEDGSIRGLGLRTTRRRAVRRLPPESAAPAAQVAAAAPGAADLPRIEIGSLKVVENRMSWLDATLASPLEVVFDDFGLEASGIGLFGDPARDAPATARFRAWSRARELLKELAVEGTLATRPGSLDFDLAIQGMASGIRARRFQPYLDPAGLEEKVQEAEIAGRLDLSLAAEEGGFRASAQVRDFSIRNAGEPVVGASLASVRDVRWRDGRLEIASIEVEEGRTHVARDPAGALLAFGLRIPLSVFRARQPEPEAEPAPAPDEGSSRAEATLAQLPNVRVESVRIADAELAWLDGSYDPPVASSARFDLEIQGLDTRPAPQPTRFDVRIGVGDSVEEIRVAGTAELQTTAARIAATCRTRGLRAGALGSYLPAGITCDLEAGHLDFDGSIDVRAVPAGGLAADVRVGPARLDDGPRHLLALESFELGVDRADPAAGVFEIGALRTAGLEVEVVRAADGLHALGFGLGERPASPEVPVPPAPATAAGASGLDFTPGGTPRVVLGMLDLGIARLAFRDEVRGTEPVELALRLRAPEGQTLVDREPQALPPTRLTIEGAALPLVRAWRLDLEASPWIAEPRLAAEFQAEGIAGGGLASVDPSLPVWIDGTGVADAVATGSLEARVKWKRRSPLDLDLRGGFSGELSVGRLEMRDAPGGEVLAAIDGIDAEIERVDLARGDVRVKTLEIRKPELRAWRGDDGLHVLGLVARPELRPAAPSPAPAARPVVAKQAPEPAAGGEIRIDELRVRGVSIELRDEAGDPPTKIPLEDLDVVVQRFTTRAFREPLTVRFDAWLGAGEAELPRTAPDRGLVAGLASAVGDVVSGGEKAYGTERRKMFQEAVLSGSVKLYPQLTGHAQASLTGLELVGLRGTAKHEGLEIGDGTLDASVRLRFRGKDGVRVDSELVFTDLSLSEPKRGPVETYLSLPVPLDTVLFLLRNAEGEHRIPVGFTLDEEGLTRARLVGAAVGATTSVIAGAVASAPLRVASTFTDLFGITGGKKSGLPSAEIEFAPGSAALSPQAIDALARVLGPVSSNGRLAVQAQHRFGAADLQRAAILANPSAEDSLEIATGLRRRRAELARSRAEVAADARALWGVGDRKRAEAASLHLRELDAASGSVEDGLDRVLELLKPGADRHREKRTRSAALALGRARLEAVRAWLAAQGVAELEDRFEARPPVFEAGSGAGGGTVLLVLRRR